jgi:polysaccharide export outer membrane protein
VGDIRAFSRTVPELQQGISDVYAGIGHPEIEVTPILTETGAQRVYVLGEVIREGFYEMAGDTTVLDAIAMAQGFEDRANDRSVMVIRRMEDGTMQGQRVNMSAALRDNDFSQNIYLRPYDIVYVPREYIADVNIWIDQYVTRGLYALFDRPIDWYIGSSIARESR